MTMDDVDNEVMVWIIMPLVADDMVVVQYSVVGDDDDEPSENVVAEMCTISLAHFNDVNDKNLPNVYRWARWLRLIRHLLVEGW